MSENNLTSILPAFPSEPPFESVAAAFTLRRTEDQKNTPGPGHASDAGDGPNARRDIHRMACKTLGLDAESFTSGVQVHGEKIVRVTERERGRGAFDYYEGIPDTDALITDLAGVPLGVFTADCVPVFLFDPLRRAVGMVHAGWRSTVRSITELAVRAMNEKLGCDPANLWAAIGPSIGQCCYEVGGDVHAAFSAAFKYADSLFRKTGSEKWHLDLWRANCRQLMRCGIKEERIIRHDICSACNCDRFFSARRLGPRSGRTLSLIALRDKETGPGRIPDHIGE